MGHVLSKRQIGTADSKIEDLHETREPEDARKVKTFLGLVNFCARFILNLATTQNLSAFNQLRNALTDESTLAFLEKGAKTQLIAYASPVGISAVLVQEQTGESRVLSYASRRLTNVVVLFIIVTCVYIVHIYIYKQMYIVNTPSPFGLISHVYEFPMHSN